jgi:probable rRNA maturation factor
MPSPEPHVSFRRAPASLDRAQIQNFAEALKNGLARQIEFHCLVTTDAELRRLNAQFLGKDYATDVLSFPELGDVAISYQRARAQAARFGHSVEDEIRILMLHGTLHLIGMDHETDGGAMARAEARWRRKLGLPGSLIARARA